MLVMETLSFAVAMLFKGVALFAFLCALALVRVAVARWVPACRLKSFLLHRVDDPNGRERDRPGEGSGTGHLWRELTRDIRALRQ